MKRRLCKIFGFALIIFIFGCVESNEDEDSGRDYRQNMRDFVQAISSYAKGIKSTIPDTVKTTEQLREFVVNELQVKANEQKAIFNRSKIAGVNFVEGIRSGVSEQSPALARAISAVFGFFVNLKTKL